MNTINQMKNIIVLKDLPSNVIEEAFVILKQNKKMRIINKEENNTNEEQTRDYIVKEAEMVISSYLSSVEEDNKIRSKTIKQMENKYKRLKKFTTLLSIIFAINIILNLLIK